MRHKTSFILPFVFSLLKRLGKVKKVLLVIKLQTFHNRRNQSTNCPITTADKKVLNFQKVHTIKSFSMHGQVCSLFYNGTIPASFCLFSFFSLYNFNNTNRKKCRWCICDLNPGPQDGWCRQNHGAMAAALFFNLTTSSSS